MYLCTVIINNYEKMEAILTGERVSPLERARLIARKKGWGPLTEEEKKELDDVVRMVTNLN